MKKVVFVLSIIISSLSATTIEELVNSSFSKNYDLKGLEKSIEVANHQIKLAKNWENPMLEFKTNMIMLNKNYIRDQKEYGVEISQAIPIGYKLDIEESIAKKDRNIQEIVLDDKKLELESKIYSYSYNILILENRLKFLEQYKRNQDKLENLYSKLYKYEKANFNEILNTQISKYDIDIQINELKTTIENLYINLEIITYVNIDNLSGNLEFKSIDNNIIEDSFYTHPQIKILELTNQRYKDYAKLEEAKKFSSITLSVEYMQNKDQDYANISIGMPLPIYKTENINKLKANLNANETNDKQKSQIHNLKLQTKIYLNNLEKSKQNYKIIQKQIIPLKQKLQKVLENSTIFEKANLEESVKNLNELLDYEIKANEELAKYFENYSELIYYSNKGVL
ncbi:TolC family protein [Aliarcobacter lanthieri]|uniref:TolC family protein n=1 Tax=Aliarcobacter lanthieri TaxID=1355374 RepID=UPI00047C3795|nr:TolC family protein [Aliarcobacter lanthieri]QKF58210.1 outer membrane efflux protein, TolC family, putative CusC [Aliarcobacter lanthieri]